MPKVMELMIEGTSKETLKIFLHPFLDSSSMYEHQVQCSRIFFAIIFCVLNVSRRINKDTIDL